MKNGTVAETGKHDDLMLKNGDYAKLYNIQASAFSSEVSSAPKEKLEAGIEGVNNMEKLGYKEPSSNGVALVSTTSDINTA